MGWGIRTFLTGLGLIAASACAEITGLPDYTNGDPTTPRDSSVSPGALTPDTEAPDAEAPDATTTADTSGQDSGADGTRPGQVELGPDADEPIDAEGGADAGAPSDAGEPTDADFAPDNYVCGTSTCGGCCSASGDCVGGQSVGTCGVGGVSCKDCSSSGACSAGACTVKQADAGPPPMCDVTMCSNNNCAGYPIQAKCCKLSDQTCGCHWTAFAPCL